MAKPSAEQIEARLWNAEVTDVQQALLDQYKLYVEMADRISARRGLTNTFFLTLNSAIFTLFGVLWKDKPADLDDAIVLLLAAVALGQCAAWGILVRSYRLLNGAKYDVIGLMEKRPDGEAAAGVAVRGRVAGTGRGPGLEALRAALPRRELGAVRVRGRLSPRRGHLARDVA
jgi:hypothetical protein